MKRTFLFLTLTLALAGSANAAHTYTPPPEPPRSVDTHDLFRTREQQARLRVFWLFFFFWR